MTNDTKTTRSRHEVLVGLDVSDDAGYAKYRAGMTPLLEACGGFFRYDFTIERTLKAESKDRINRLFIISFPDEATKNAFFSDERYLAIRSKHFDSAVQSVTRIADYMT